MAACNGCYKKDSACVCVCVCMGIKGGESPKEKDKEEKKMSRLYHFAPALMPLQGPLKGTEMEVLARAHQKKI